MKKVAIIRGRGIAKSEIINYEKISGYDITLIGPSNEEYKGPLQYESFRSPLSLPKPFQQGIRAVNGLIKGVDTILYNLTEKLSKYDILHVEETYHGYTLQALNAKKRYGCSVVSTTWETIPYFLERGHPSRTTKQKIAKRNTGKIKKRVQQEADALIPTTEQAKSALLIEGVDENKIHKISIGVDLNKFNTHDYPTDNNVGDRFNFTVDGTNIVYIGRTPWEKGIFDLILAWKKILNNINDEIELSIIGSDENYRQLQMFISNLNLTNVSIHRPIPYDDIPLVMNRADILVLPSIPTASWQEQYGRVIPESQACGTAVVASDTGGIPEAAGNIGRFTRPGDVDCLAQNIIELVKNDKERKELARKGQKHVREHRTVDHTASQVQSLYDRICDD